MGFGRLEQPKSQHCGLGSALGHLSEEGTGTGFGLGSAHCPEGVPGSGSGTANAQYSVVAGGCSLFCKLICLSLSLVPVSHLVHWLCPKPRRAPVGCVSAGFPSLFGSGDSLLVRTFPSHFHGTSLRFWWLFPAVCSAERMKTETGYSSPSNIIFLFLYEGQLLLLTLLKHIISSGRTNLLQEQSPSHREYQ